MLRWAVEYADGGVCSEAAGRGYMDIDRAREIRQAVITEGRGTLEVPVFKVPGGPVRGLVLRRRYFRRSSGGQVELFLVAWRDPGQNHRRVACVFPGGKVELSPSGWIEGHEYLHAPILEAFEE